MRSAVSSPLRRSSWSRVSNSWKAIWRTTVFSMSSTLPAIRMRRRLGSLLAREQRAEGQHLAEDRGGLGQGQRRIGHQRALRPRQHLMHAMAQLMGQRHHVAGAAVVVQQDIGMGARRRPDGRRRPAPCPAAPAHRSSPGRRSARRSSPAPARRRHRRRARSSCASAQGMLRSDSSGSGALRSQ